MPSAVKVPRGICKTSPKSALAWDSRICYIEWRCNWLVGHTRNCPVGWLPILEQAALAIQQTNCTDFVTLSIREQFGDFVWNVETQSLEAWNHVTFAKQRALTTCSVCGTSYDVEYVCWGGSRLTLCDACDELSGPQIMDRMYPAKRRLGIS